MKAILIARVSTEEQKEAGLSLPAQLARLEKYCQVKHYEILKTFSFDESAYKTDRDEFEKILDYVLGQKEKVAVCLDKVDRLSRNIFDKRVSLLYEKALNDELELHFVNDGQVVNSKISAAQKFQFSISLGLAKYYSDAISDNVKRANEQKLRKGEWTGKSPYGYRYITHPDGRKDIITDEQTAHVVKKAFELYATGAYSLKLLCEKLKHEYAIDWKAAYLHKIFNNHFYYGVMVVKGRSYPHKYPPLISKTLFDQVQQIKQGFNKKPAKYAGLPYMYRGLLRCADCGMAITPEKHKGHVYYHCTQYKGKHGAKWVREEEITKQLGAIFKRLQIPANVLQPLLSTLNNLHQQKIEFHNKHYDLLTNQRKALTSRMDKLYIDKLDGKISDEDYERFYQKFKNEADDIDGKLANLQQAETSYYTTAKYILNLATKAYALFTGSEVEEKRQLIKLVLSNLRLDGEKLVYDAQKPFDVIMKCHDDQLWRPQRDSNSCSRRERAMS